MALIGELLVKYGLISHAQLDEALACQKKTKKKLGEILIEKGYLQPKDLFWILSEQADIPFIELKPEMIANQLINLFPKEILYECQALPIFETEKSIYMVIGNPADPKLINKLKQFTDKEIIVSGAAPETIIQMLDNLAAIPSGDKSSGPKGEAQISIRIINQPAEIEILNDTGKIEKKQGRADIIIHIKEFKNRENGRDQ
ncbi:MAG: hypothetical protein ABIL05_02695 [candidate division WOR-3 bacterium]